MRNYNHDLYPNFENFLNTAQQFIVADLWTFYVITPAWSNVEGLTNYAVAHNYTSWDRDVVIYDEYGSVSEVYAATGPIIEREKVRSVIGMEVDRLQVRVYANDTMLIGGRPFLQAAVRGDLDGSRVSLKRAFFNSDFELQGVLTMFDGRTAPAKVSRSMAEFEVAADLELLNLQMPRNLYQAGCQNTLYDAKCKLSQVDSSRSLYVGSAPSTTQIYATSSLTAGLYDLGGLIFTSGELEGVVATVKTSESSGRITLVNALPFTPAISDTFVIWKGCNKTRTACENKFNNLENFRGFPYVPVPETMR